MTDPTFSDSDLKRWRKELADARAQQVVSYFKINDSEMAALLARLEAAEQKAERYEAALKKIYHTGTPENMGLSDCYFIAKEALKAAGK